MNSTSPADIFGGTWEQITDRFLYCANSSGTTGGLSTLSEANLPAYTHTFTGVEATDDLQIRRMDNRTMVAGIISSYSNNGIFSVNLRSGDSWGNTIEHLSYDHQCDIITWTYTPSGILSETGSREEFLPPYIAVYAWYHTA